MTAIKPSTEAAGDFINFANGQPDDSLLPLELLEEASRHYFRTAEPAELNYGDYAGDEGFRQELAAFLSEGYGESVTAETLFQSAGASQALDLSCTLLCQAGDTVFVEEPTYFLALGIFAQHRLRMRGIPMDQDGLDMDALESALRNDRPAFLYTIPTYHNPSGRTMPEERRERLVELSRRHGFMIVADEVYHMLSYVGTPPSTMASRLDGETVISIGSFSKILAPAMRLGWIQAAPSVIRKFEESGVVISGGALNQFTSGIVRSALKLGLQATHLERVRSTLAERAEAMEAALHRHVGRAATWTRPDGGYFFWLTLPEGSDCVSLRAKARSAGVGFQPGSIFGEDPMLRRCLRLSFAHYALDGIEEGMSRLGRLLAG